MIGAMRRDGWRPALGAFVVVLGLVGCAGNDDSGSAAEKQAFIAQGERLCVEFKGQLDRLFEDFLPTLSRRAATYSQVVPLARDFSRRFASLRPPEGDEARIRDSLRHYDEGLHRLEQGVVAAREGDLDRSNAAFEAAFAAFGRSDEILRSYGFDVCAEPKTNRSYFALPEEARREFSEEKKRFLQQGETICKTANERLSQLETATFRGGIPDLVKWREFLTGALPVFQTVVDQLSALTPPADDKATISLMVDTYKQALTAARRAHEAASAGDQVRFNAAMEDVARLTAAGDDLSTRYGFRECKER